MQKIKRTIFLPIFSLIILISFFGIATAAEFTQKELAYMPATMQIELFKRGVITPLDVLKAQKAQYDRNEKKVNATTFAYWDNATKMAEESARRYANGTYRELEGITVGVKDEHYDKGWKVAMGSLVHKDDPPKDHADPIVSKLKAAGAIPVLQATVPELYFNWTTHTRLYGVTRNPWNLKYAVGGSSGGSGAVLAAGYVTIATGSDMGGSVRIPSSFNGVYGIKPSFGTMHTEMPQAYFSGTGPMAKTFEDVVMMYNVINGPGSGPYSPNVLPNQRFPLKYQSIKGMRIAYLGGMGITPMAKHVEKAMNNAIEVLKAQGAVVDRVDFDFNLQMPLTELIGKLALGGTMGGMLRAGYADKLDQMTHYGQYFVNKALNDGYGPDEVYEVELEVNRMYAVLSTQTFAKGYEVVLAPTMPTAHVPADHDFTKKVPLEEDGITFPVGVGMQYTLPFNALNWCPVMSVPAGISDQGMPIGMQIIGKPHDNGTMLRVGYAFSKGGMKLYNGDLFPKID